MEAVTNPAQSTVEGLWYCVTGVSEWSLGKRTWVRTPAAEENAFEWPTLDGLKNIEGERETVEARLWEA